MNLQKQQVEHIFAKPNPSNIFEWHFVIHGLKDTIFTGVYHGKLILPTEYPFKPPNIQFITPNGRFKPNEQICLSFTNYHPESWSVVWDIQKMLIALVSFMMTEEATTGMIRSSNYERSRYAKYSVLFNLKNQEFTKVFNKSNLKEIGIDPNIISSPQSLQAFEQQQKSEIGGVDSGQSKKMIFFVLSIFGVLLSYAILKSQQVI